MRLHALCLVCAALLALPGMLPAASVTLNPTKDNTLIENTSPTGQLSNGQGDILVGRTAQPSGSIRRGLIAFDIAGNIPSGSTITSVTLSMTDAMGLNGDRGRVAPLESGLGRRRLFAARAAGAPAQQGDATWLYTFFNATTPSASPKWTSGGGDTPGGNFNALVSASTVLLDNGSTGPQLFSWSSAQMAADVQSWLNSPSGNFGWLLKLNDESIAPTAKRLTGGESTPPPSLLINYVVPEPSTMLLLAASCVGLIALAGLRRRSP